MQSLAYIPSSNGAANASLMTVTNVRAANAGTILVNTVANVPAKFYASMGTPHTFTDPVTGETITVISETSAVDFAGSVSGSSINIDAIAPGYTDAGSKVGDIIVIRPVTEWANNIFNTLSKSLNDDGSLKAAAYTYDPVAADFVSAGGIWTQISTGLSASMTALTVWQGGYMGTIAALASRAFTVSKDTYVDVLRTLSGYTNTFTLVYTEVSNGAASPALAANSVRIAKVVTSASAITSVTQIHTDTLGNPIKPVNIISSRHFINSQGQINYTNVANYAVNNDLTGATWTFTPDRDTMFMAFLEIRGGNATSGNRGILIVQNGNILTPEISQNFNSNGGTLVGFTMGIALAGVPTTIKGQFASSIANDIIYSAQFAVVTLPQ